MRCEAHKFKKLNNREKTVSMWIYQFSLGSEYAFTPEEFRYQIWEGQRTRWPYQIKRAKEPLAIGDTLVFFFTPKGGNSDPGVYGWAVVDRCDIKNKVSFIPTTPTNHLKMHPWWDKENELSKNLLGEIRGGMKQGTLFLVREKHQISAIRDGIKQWLHQ